MDYGAIIKRSVELTWRNRLLWVFGILVAIFAGGAGGNAGQGLQYTFNQQDMERWRRTMPYGMLPWRQLAAVGVGLIIVLVLLVLVWIVVRVIVGYTSEGALVAAADDLDRGRKPTFREAFSRGWQRFLRLFAQDVIIGLIAFVVALIVLLAYAIVAGLILAPGIVAVAANGAISRTLGIIWLVLLGIVVFVGFVRWGSWCSWGSCWSSRPSPPRRPSCEPMRCEPRCSSSRACSMRWAAPGRCCAPGCASRWRCGCGWR